ncbi:unnamed protein product [Blepharisma stoltei]|uniref:cAMP-dependent protein kinase regulatory subunit n=1 Tax=Blepharisma stoltei TaxID=1481888 RepID=A0AAU9K298_9CILI|nr:unnamed protein product [Blepharisma stoltei]
MKPEDREYLTQKVNPIMEVFVEYALQDIPPDLYQYMLNYLKRISLSDSERAELERLKLVLAQVQEGKKSDEEVSTDENEESEDEAPEIVIVNRSFQHRTSVSAEAYGAWNKKGNFVPRVINKTDEQKSKIMAKLSVSFIFSHLEEKDKKVVIDAMESKSVRNGEFVIRQGEDGDLLYIVESGKLECTKVINGNETFLKFYETGGVFGELALLYNAPRAATIKAVVDSELWALDRSTFVNIVKEAAVKRRERFEILLSRVKILESMDTYEKVQIADALTSATYASGEYIIREGEWGDLFYMIEEGTAVATKTLHPGMPPEEVMRYQAGDYFGELALLKDDARAANVIATSDIKCVTLDRHAFKRLLGPLEEILRRNFEVYESVINGLSKK